MTAEDDGKREKLTKFINSSNAGTNIIIFNYREIIFEDMTLESTKT
jgi:hypothetical protein